MAWDDEGAARRVAGRRTVTDAITHLHGQDTITIPTATLLALLEHAGPLLAYVTDPYVPDRLLHDLAGAVLEVKA